MIIIREEKPEDIEGIEKVFGQLAKNEIVDKLPESCKKQERPQCLF